MLTESSRKLHWSINRAITSSFCGNVTQQREVFRLISVTYCFPSKSRISIYESSRETEVYWMFLRGFLGYPLQQRGKELSAFPFCCTCPLVCSCLQSTCWRAPAQCKLCTKMLCWSEASVNAVSLSWGLSYSPSLEMKRKKISCIRRSKKSNLPAFLMHWSHHAWSWAFC